MRKRSDVGINISAIRGPWRWVAGLAALLLTTGTAIGVILAVLSGGSGAAHADALCDQMRLEHGPHWPCINVPTYTPQPTQNTPPPTGTSPGAPGNGPNAGGSPGPGPGTGNGTPIIPVPGYRAPGLPGQRPPAPTRQTGQRPAPPNTGRPVPPPAGRSVPPGSRPQPSVSPQAPAPVTVPGPAADSPAKGGGQGLPVWFWAATGGLALFAGSMSRSRRTVAAVVPPSPAPPLRGGGGDDGQDLGDLGGSGNSDDIIEDQLYNPPPDSDTSPAPDGGHGNQGPRPGATTRTHHTRQWSATSTEKLQRQWWWW